MPRPPSEDCNCGKDDSADRDRTEWFKIGILVAVGFWALNLILALVAWSTGMLEKVASLGDALAIVNALFSSVAVAGAVYAVLLQQRELTLTREEMRQAREAHEDSADAQERMVLMQGYTTLLTGATLELETAVKRRDELRKLRLQVHNFLKTNGHRPERVARLDGAIHEEAKDLLHQGEIEGLCSMDHYPENDQYDRLTQDFFDFARKIGKEHDERVARVRSPFLKIKRSSKRLCC